MSGDDSSHSRWPTGRHIQKQSCDLVEEAQRTNERLFMKKMQYQEWLGSFYQDWLKPRLSAAVGVFAITKAFTWVPPETEVPEVMYENFMAALDTRWLNWVVWAACFLAVLLFVAVVIRHRNGGRRRNLHGLTRRIGVLSAAANFALGALLFPVVVVMTVYAGRGWEGLGATLHIGVLCLGVVGCAAGFHALGMMDSHPYGALTYVVHTGEGSAAADLRPRTLHRLQTLRKELDCRWIGDVAVVAETEDSAITLVIPITLRVEAWDADDRARWAKLCMTAEQEWEKEGFNVTMAVSPSLSELAAPKTGAGKV